MELIAVMTILGMLASIVGWQTRNLMQNSRRKAAALQIARFAEAVEAFHNQSSKYPTSQEGLLALVKGTASVPALLKDHKGQVPKDPWKNEYVYKVPGTNSAFEIMSYGADGLRGGEGFDADISSADLSDN